MLVRVWCLLCVLTLLARDVCGGEYSHTIYVDPERGHNSTACLNSPSPSRHPCRNLSYAFQYRNSSTRYLLQPGTHYLDTTVSFTALNDIAITGNSSVDTVRILCTIDNSGLSFINAENIYLGNVNFTQCSSQQKSTNFNCSSRQFQLVYIRSALYFSHCENISMYHVVISESSDANAITIYNSIGTNNFAYCTFSNNTGLTDCSSQAGGGGVYIEFSYCLPGNVECENGTEVSYTDHNKDSVYNFTECEFSNNNNSVCGFMHLFLPYRQFHTAVGVGGGLSIFFRGNATDNSVVVTNCTFSRNSAELGAGMYVEFADSSIGNSVTVNGRKCTFFDNFCHQYDGGGMHIGHMLTDSTLDLKGNSVNIRSCNFSKNQATNGGGIQMTSLKQKANNSKLFHLIISEVIFDSNQGQFGAALGILQFDSILNGEDPVVNITNCTFKNNTIYPSYYTQPREVGRGAVYTDSVDIQFYGTNLFQFNSGTALVIVSASADITDSHMCFSRNSGVNGGAIAMLGSTRLIINDNTSVLFDHNFANITGGAIYKELSSKADINDCLVRHQNISLTLYPDEWNAKFTFANNFVYGNTSENAGNTENAIFSTSVRPCVYGIIDNVFCWKNWVYSYNGVDVEGENCSKFIRTGPGQISFNTTVNANSSQEVPAIPTICAYPGEKIHLPIIALDELNHSLQTVFAVSGHSDSESAILDMNYAYTSNNHIRVLGITGGNLTVDLYSVGDRKWHVKLRVHLNACPPGLLSTPTQTHDNLERDISSSCECNTQKNFAGHVQCNTDTEASLASGYWMGWWTAADGRQFYVVAGCPGGLCRTAKTGFIPLPRTNLDMNNVICGAHHRTGRVCGECIDGYGPVLNSEEYMCVPCNVSKHQLAMHITYYILAVYVPLFLLFLGIIVFNIKLTTGPANAFILYSQVISSTLNLDADSRLSLRSMTHHMEILIRAYKFPHGIFNLKFFEHFVPLQYMCLGTCLNLLDIFLLDCLVAFFPLLMVIAITIIYRIADYFPLCHITFPKCKNGPLERLRNALLPAFASFILLSYTKFSLASSYIFAMAGPRNASGHIIYPLHVSFAGQYAYNDREYLVRYLLPASVIFLTFVSIPPLMLLDHPLRVFEKVLKKFPCLWRYYPYDKVHIMLDAFQGCYKNKWRCFAGLYFVFRLLINTTNALCNDMVQFVLQEIYCIVFALLVAFLKPYKRNYHLLNYVDSLIFLNLAVINLLTLFLYADTRMGTKPSAPAFSVQYVLVFLPLLYMVSYIVWWLLPIPNVRARARQWMVKRQRAQRLENLIQDTTPEPEDDVDWERAEATNHYKPAPCHGSLQHGSVTARGRETSIVVSSCIAPCGDGRLVSPRRRNYGSTNSSTTTSCGSAADDY